MTIHAEEKTNYAIFDLETIPNPDVDRTTLSDPSKVPALCHVVVCATVILIKGKDTTAAGWLEPEVGEKGILDELFPVLEGRRLVTWAGRFFDIPVLLWRAMYYGIQADWIHEAMGPRFREDVHIDLADQLSYFNSTHKTKLLHSAQALRMPGKETMDGSMVDQYYEEGKLEEIKKYCFHDVFQTAVILLRWKHVRGIYTTEQYNHYIKSMVESLKTENAIPEWWENALLEVPT